MTETKQSYLWQAYRAGHVIDLYLNRQEVIGLPRDLYASTDPVILLQLGRHLPIPVTDLFAGTLGFQATLRFGRVPHAVSAPWKALFATMVTTRGDMRAYLADAPPGFFDVQAPKVSTRSSESGITSTVRKRAAARGLRVIEGGKQHDPTRNPRRPPPGPSAA